MTTSLGAESPVPHPDDLAGLEARLLGPAVASGRVTSIDAVAADPDTVWVGAASGGVWKSTDGALTWTPVFDDAPIHSIGAVAIFQADPDIVWVGTGEGNPRNSVSTGDGVYRTLDGGETWTHLGLERTRHIHRVIPHPEERDTAWVAAVGTPWVDDEHRGVYRTRDGGKTWERVLFVDEATGAADLVRAADGTLLAAMWEHRRRPWRFDSGGPGSGVFRSTDDGDTWTRLGPEDGLPSGDLGRIGLAFAPSDPRVAYAFVEHEGPDHLLLRSNDGGRSWEKAATSAEQPIGDRPFYYADLRVDPRDPRRLYSLWTAMSVSEDGGETWRTIAPFHSVHADHHALWIAPGDPTLLYDGNDGGVAVSRSHGETWRYVENLPLEQFYHVRVDEAVPFRVYGGTQDNGSWVGPSEVWEVSGVRAAHWREIDVGDGFDAVPMPGRLGEGYSLTPTGILSRFDLETGETSDVIRPEAPAGEKELRYGWDAPLELDPFDPAGLYFGSQYVHYSNDRGASWTRISPDLTSDREEWQGFRKSGGLTIDVSGAESFTTLSTLSASPLAEGTLWAGSDDGRIHLTLDDGETWTRLDERLPKDAPENARVSTLRASRHDPAVAFLGLDAHEHGDETPYLYRTDDRGATWTRLAAPDDGDGDSVRGWVHIVLQDPVEPDLVFLGTELGLWLSLDRGASWHPFRAGLPRVAAVRDLALQERDGALVIATHGRGLFVVDHVQPLRELASVLRERPAIHLFDPAPSVRHGRGRPPGPRFPGDGTFEGENPPYGASFYLWLGEDLPEEAEAPSLTVVDPATGRVLRQLPAPRSSGLHRVTWDLLPDRPTLPGGFPASRFEVLPGIYEVSVTHSSSDTASHAVPFEILGDPRLAELSPADQRARRDAIDEATKLLDELLESLREIQRLRAELTAARALLDEKQRPHTSSKFRRLDAFTARLDELALRLQYPGDKHRRYRDRVLDETLKALWVLDQSQDAPDPSQLRYLERARAFHRDFLAEAETLFAQIDAHLDTIRDTTIRDEAASDSHSPEPRDP